ncbi:PIG-L family deacetylase [Lacihabitans sp. CS3-21]|uniref:PIG-L family deacetylase n=1 Tax=Lacihabitans sp. CS3-21 TaxID=2487332 RepID=UPI0020CDF218|nr:PIG-L family deacetylase [Lacihabitans sp. CS3-21]MCP9747152.1 PIG-L family deacetylase [Lacihabitans sp. CS3-21]
MKKLCLLVLLFYCTEIIQAQPKALSSSEIYQHIQKLNTVGNAMYIAAHPDDENTLLIAWLSKEKKVRTAYMAMTRGDGGQNLIGSEQGEYVGLLRTHELLEARKIDGGEQYFSRAVDFGFSKQTEEALSTWGKDKILEDLVYQIRKFQPDVLINRFPPDARAGHGHHSASAVLAAEAFDAAADPTKFPEQLKNVKVWQAKRLVWNTFNRGFTNAEPTDGPFIKLPLADYSPLLGKSYSEIAAEARSKHRSQGFGSAPTRNERFDFAINIKGEPAKEDLFDGIDLTWRRIQGGEPIGKALDDILSQFDFKSPSKSVKNLIEVYKAIEKTPESIYKTNKLSECLNLILACSGIYCEANAATNMISPGQSLKVFATAVNRSNLDVKIENFKIYGAASKDSVLGKSLTYNKSIDFAVDTKIPATAGITQPYWLNEKPEKGIYKVLEDKFRGLPMAPDALWAEFTLNILGESLKYTHPIKYKYTEPSIGEIYKYLEIRPEIMLNLDQKVYIFADNKPKKVGVMVKSNIANNSTKVKLNLAAGWNYEPKEIEVNFTEKNQEKPVFFTVTPPTSSSETEIKALATTANGTFSKSLKNVKYEHIPELNVFPEATAKANRINLLKKGQNIAYIAGAGDEVPESLKQIGYDLTNLNETTIKGNLAKYDAIIVGVRAYNTEDWLVNAQNTLFEYVKNGGNLIVQYQTQAFYGTVKTKELGPFPISIGRGRVTEENAEMKVLRATDPILNTPNKIDSKDYDGWIQERGLYFAEKWSDKYTSVYSIKDTGETEQEGSLLYTKYGKGTYIFTGLSFFRQLPAGVPGAFRLMANLISFNKK